MDIANPNFGEEIKKAAWNDKIAYSTIPHVELEDKFLVVWFHRDAPGDDPKIYGFYEVHPESDMAFQIMSVLKKKLERE